MHRHNIPFIYLEDIYTDDGEFKNVPSTRIARIENSMPDIFESSRVLPRHNIKVIEDTVKCKGRNLPKILLNDFREQITCDSERYEHKFIL